MLEVGCWKFDVGCWKFKVEFCKLCVWSLMAYAVCCKVAVVCWMLDVWHLEAGCWKLYVGCWTLDSRCCEL